MSEAEFLDAQAAEARAAMNQTWDDVKSTLQDTASLEVWAKRHPWVVTGAAVAGGFLIATLLFAPPQPAVVEKEEQAPRPTPADRPHRLAWMIGPLFNLLRPMLGQLIASLVAAVVGSLTTSMAGTSSTDADESNSGGPPPDDGPVPF
ncbi:MAG TPA: hypothetical protein VHC22_09845 [Pirellulales bacterium]|nr:hypothetical protein [Pirellulales bacterium]